MTTVPDDPRVGSSPALEFLSRAGRLHPFAIILGALAVVAIGQGIVALPVQVALGSSPVATSFTAVSSFIGVWLALWLWMRFVDHRPLRDLGLVGRPRDLWIGVLLAVAILGLDVVVMAAGGWADPAWAHPGAKGLGIILGTLVLFAIQGPAEEIVLRGYLMQGVAARWGIPAGLGLQAVLFALLHGANPDMSWLAVLNIALFGLLLGMLVLWRGSLWAAMGFHALWNWLQGLVLGFDVSGMSFGTSLLAQHPRAGAALWTGGSFGAEGSVLTTWFCTVAIVVVAVAWRRSTAR